MRLLLLVLAALGLANASPPSQPVDICPGGCTIEQDVPAAQRKALDGSPEYARGLAELYAAENNLDEALYWSGVAIENGDDESRYNHAYMLYLKADARSLRRALFHLRAIEEKALDGSTDALRVQVEKKLKETEKSAP